MIIFEGMNAIDCTDDTRRVLFQRNKVMIELRSVFHPAMAGVVPSRVLPKLMKFQKSSRIQFKNYGSHILDCNSTNKETNKKTSKQIDKKNSKQLNK